MDLATAYAVFVRVAERQGFSKVARELSLSQPSVSRIVGDLEEHLGARLFSRTTRRVALTDEGRELLPLARGVLRALEDAETAVGRRADEYEGRLRLFAPVSLGRMHVVPRLAEFLAQHPKVDVEVRLSDKPVGLVAEGIDVAIAVGAPTGQSDRRRQLGAVSMILAAAPAYLGRIGHPASVPELRDHVGIVFIGPDVTYDTWALRDRDDNETLVRVPSRFRTDSSEAAREALLAGLGIGLVPTWLVDRDLDRGDLVRVLPAISGPALPVAVVYPENRGPTARLRAFLDYLVFSLAGDAIFVADS